MILRSKADWIAAFDCGFHFFLPGRQGVINGLRGCHIHACFLQQLDRVVITAGNAQRSHPEDLAALLEAAPEG